MGMLQLGYVLDSCKKIVENEGHIDFAPEGFEQLEELVVDTVKTMAARNLKFFVGGTIAGTALTGAGVLVYNKIKESKQEVESEED